MRSKSIRGATSNRCGVVLYELLTGSTPFPRVKLRQGAYLEIVRRIREEETPKSFRSERRGGLAEKCPFLGGTKMPHGSYMPHHPGIRQNSFPCWRHRQNLQNQRKGAFVGFAG